MIECLMNEALRANQSLKSLRICCLVPLTTKVVAILVLCHLFELYERLVLQRIHNPPTGRIQTRQFVYGSSTESHKTHRRGFQGN